MIRQSSLVTLNNVLGAAQGFLALFVVARYMGDEVLGARAFAIALVGIVGLVARLGLPTTHVQRLASGENVGDSNGAFAVLKLGLATGFAILGVSAGWLYFDVFGRNVTDTSATALYLAFAVILIQAVRDIPVHSFQGLRMILEREAVLFANTAATVLLTVWAAVAYAASHSRWLPTNLGSHAAEWLGIHHPLSGFEGLHLVMWGVVIAEAAALGLALTLFASRRLPLHLPKRVHVRAYLLFTLPLMLLSLGEVLTKWLGQVVVGFFSDARAVGHYAGAAKLTELFLLVPMSLMVVLLPAASRLHSLGRSLDARRLAGRVQHVVSLISWPGLALILAWPGPLLHILLSDAFQPAQASLQILAFQTVLAGMVLATQALAVGLGQPARAARIVVMSLLVGLVLNLVLVPDHLGPVPLLGLGATGAACASLAATILAAVLYRRPHGAWPGHGLDWPVLGRHALAGLIVAAILFVIPAPTRFLGLGAYALASLAMYAGLAWLLGAFSRADFESLRRAWKEDVA